LAAPLPSSVRNSATVSPIASSVAEVRVLSPVANFLPTSPITVKPWARTDSTKARSISASRCVVLLDDTSMWSKPTSRSRASTCASRFCSRASSTTMPPGCTPTPALR
jgi:hypothetical protein